MVSILWLIVVILVIAWLLGLGGVFHLALSILWIFLIVAIILAVLAFFTGGYWTR